MKRILATVPRGSRPRPAEERACPRCGRVRLVKTGRRTTLCRDCRGVDPTFGEAS